MLVSADNQVTVGSVAHGDPGMLRLKKHKTSGAKRMLSRNSATGKIMVVSGYFVDWYISRTTK